MCAPRWQRKSGITARPMVDVPRTPRFSGSALKNLARFARTRVGTATLQRVLRGELRIDRLAGLPDELRGDVPLDTNPHPGRPPRQMRSSELPLPAGGWAPTSARIAKAYRE